MARRRPQKGRPVTRGPCESSLEAMNANTKQLIGAIAFVGTTTIGYISSPSKAEACYKQRHWLGYCYCDSGSDYDDCRVKSLTWYSSGCISYYSCPWNQCYQYPYCSADGGGGGGGGCDPTTQSCY
jgi:hypothetical protein